MFLLEKFPEKERDSDSDRVSRRGSSGNKSSSCVGVKVRGIRK